MSVYGTEESREDGLPENDRSRYAELDEDLLDVVMERLLVEVPGGLVVGRGTSCGIRGAAVAVDGAGLNRQQLVQQTLGSG